ncbi:MAG TPA: glycerol kinase, partial [Cytophagales bacterium]|nr:glycerol kinase [Cytophagales bacterium]
MNPNYILALDQGTTSSRAILFDAEGQMVSMAQKEFKQHFPHNGWVEHDAMEIWESQFEVAQQVLHQQGITPGQLAGI